MLFAPETKRSPDVHVFSGPAHSTTCKFIPLLHLKRCCNVSAIKIGKTEFNLMGRNTYVGQYITQTQINSLIEKQTDIVDKDWTV